MTDEIYRKAFEQAKADLEKSMERRKRAESEAFAAFSESTQLRRTVAALAALCGENVEDSMGLTEAVRTVFRMTNAAWLSVKDMKAHVEALGVGLSDLKNAEASVMSVLNRLTTAGELQASQKREKTVAGQIVQVKVWKSAQAAEAETTADDEIPF